MTPAATTDRFCGANLILSKKNPQGTATHFFLIPSEQFLSISQYLEYANSQMKAYFKLA